MQDASQRTAVIALAGPPNAGKSTLMNALVGEKVTITSAKAQTTRTRIRGIYTEGVTQLVFVDLPGLFEADRRLEKAIVKAAKDGLSDADLTCVVLDAGDGRIMKQADFVLQHLAEARTGTVFLVLNKVDQVKKDTLLTLTQDLNNLGDFAATFMVSALKGGGVADLLAALKEAAPVSPFLFPEDQITDLPNRLMAAEITREHLFHRLHQELPYQLTVETELWEPFENGDVKISQVIYLARDSHKGMVIGKGGQTLKAVSTAARQELEGLLDRRVHLNIFVKVRERWMEDAERLAIWGLQ